MATLEVTTISDMIASTLNAQDYKITDLSTTTQEYFALPQLLKPGKTQTQDGGTQIDVNIMHSTNGQAKFVAPGEIDIYAYKDVLAKGQCPWRMFNTNWVYDTRLQDMNSGKVEQILKWIEVQSLAGMKALAVLMEDAFWSKPATSSDVKTIWGVGNYAVKNASQGFNGGNPSGFTTGCIFDSTVRTNWANYTDQYAAISKPDLVTKMRRGALMTRFINPIPDGQLRSPALQRAYYACQDVYIAFGTLAEDQNDALGNDIASKEGRVLFMGHPVAWVPELDGDAQDPIYQLDWSTLGFTFLKGQAMNRKKPRINPLQHLELVVDVDGVGNLTCNDRRRLAVFATA